MDTFQTVCKDGRSVDLQWFHMEITRIVIDIFCI